MDDIDLDLPDPYVLAMRPEVRFGADVEPEDDPDLDGDPEWDLDYLADLDDDDSDEDDTEGGVVQRAEWEQCLAETLAESRVSTSSRSPWRRILPPEVIGPYTASVLEREGLSAIIRFGFNCDNTEVLATTVHHEGSESEICFRPWGGSCLTAIHEIAHVALSTPNDDVDIALGAPGHGADFVAVHLRLLAEHTNARIARLYRSAYIERGVPVPPERRRRGVRTTTSGNAPNRRQGESEPEAVAS